jgi:hypothetical protein
MSITDSFLYGVVVSLISQQYILDTLMGGLGIGQLCFFFLVLPI